MKLLTLARDLKRRKARERDRLFVAEGVRAAEELLRSSLRVVGALVAPQLSDAPRGAALADQLVARGVDVANVDPREFQSAAETESPQGVLVIAEAPERSLGALSLPPVSRLLILDAVQDPGNVGTIVRAAAALGVAATIALPGTVDLWNAKVVRSAMGALFSHPALHAGWQETEAFLRANQVVLWTADMAGEPLDAVSRADRPARLAIALGNEGGGLSSVVRAAAARRVSIPISGGVESLNVAVATGIFLYELRA